jgi:phage major head subunit gpT-like protein
MARAGIALSENFGDLLEPGLRKIYDEQFNTLPEMRPLLFNVQGSSTSYEKSSSVGSFGDMGVFKGTIGYDDVEQGYDVTYRHIQLAKGFKVERALFDDDLYNIISRKPRGLAISANRTFEKYAASLFNNAFTGSGTIVVDGETVLSNTEGQALCSTAHPYSPSDSNTQSNYGTSALSPAAVEATRIAMATIKDDRGNLISVMPDLILCPRNLEETAWEIISSKGKVDSAENNANFHFGKYKLAVWDYLTDTNNWFLIDQTMMRMYLNWFDRIPLEFFQDKSFDTLIAKYAAYCRFSFGWSDWRFIYGHNHA